MSNCFICINKILIGVGNDIKIGVDKLIKLYLSFNVDVPKELEAFVNFFAKLLGVQDALPDVEKFFEKLNEV